MSGGRGGAPDSRTGDPAAQPERTRFAWRRTTLTFAVAVALSVREAVYGGGGVSATEAGAAAAGVLAWLLFLVLAHRRITDMRADRPAGMGPGAVRAAALCTLAMATVGVVLLW
ncbi:hypothetical protein DB35_20185 [Streptomyces abyssalis]|uniref:DUF202 domain-containing protein n=1 Tax=Streptomyces abyssalis TaxID=933944 RepID=A0A1E7JUU2_9ACTN|nr:DUF202 domain-containing protein [Streptomyces abyssalis]OEU89307.1 hypothetical protein DB35_20185 [Streptomyces abyssalis]OEU93720.1 hypothetical protein AN215_02870 [Streptomyces abyssalis]OEV06692.1 hypothetical protein AN219_33780 [Streptomyces nanshensis]